MRSWNEIASDHRVLQNYQLFSELGIFEYVESTTLKAKFLDDLLNDAKAILACEGVTSIIEYSCDRLSDKFIPSTLAFIISNAHGRDEILIETFEAMKPSKVGLGIASIAPFEDFFMTYPGTISFPLFEVQLDNKELTDLFLPVNPEIVVPVVGLSGLHGLILIGSKTLDSDRKGYSADEIGYIDRLMRFASGAIQNCIHYESSVRDVKTGLFNHGYFKLRLREELARSRRSKRSLSVIVMDVDHFKLFNDKWGHLAGDAVLIGIAGALREALRAGDILARFGGEEFTVLLPDTDCDKAWLIAERLRSDVENLEIPWEGNTLKVTISLGVATTGKGLAETEDGIVNRADAALYHSKENGRNRVSANEVGLLFRASRIAGTA